MSKELRKRIDGEKRRVTVRAEVINAVFDEAAEGSSFAEKLAASGLAVEPENRFETEEAGTECELRRYTGAEADQALRWLRIAAVMQADTAVSGVTL
jgi:hypothetical protein